MSMASRHLNIGGLTGRGNSRRSVELLTNGGFRRQNHLASATGGFPEFLKPDAVHPEKLRTPCARMTNVRHLSTSTGDSLDEIQRAGSEATIQIADSLLETRPLSGASKNQILPDITSLFRRRTKVPGPGSRPPGTQNEGAVDQPLAGPKGPADSD